MILIYKMESIDNKIQMVEYGKFQNDEITGKINIKNINKDQVIEKFNRGYWRTGEIIGDK